MRLNIDPIDRPLTADAEGFLSVENGAPRFAGSVTLARPLTRAPAGSQGEILEPWRLTGKIDGNSTRAVVEQIEFQYGPDERPIRMRGDARINFGAAPRFTGVLSSPQIDLDRILALPEAQRRRPLAAIKAFADYFAGSQRLPIPVSLGVSVESLTLAGATLQRFSGDFASEANGWDIEKLELRAPGLSQLGDVGTARRRRRHLVRGANAARVEGSAHADRLADRSSGRSDHGGREPRRRRRLQAQQRGDRGRSPQGRASTACRSRGGWPIRGAASQRPPRIEAVVSAPDIDLDRAQGLLQGLFDGTVFEMPREGLLSAKIDRATLAGVEARRADVNMRFDANGLNIERACDRRFRRRVAGGQRQHRHPRAGAARRR